MVNYKLTYFDGRGRAENLRCIFHAAGIAFEDNRLPRDQWPEFKSKTPFGQMPVLEVDGQMIAQTNTIARFLGRQFGMAGKTPVEQALVEGIVDQASDFMSDVTPYFRVANGFAQGDAAALKKDVFIPACDKHLPIFKKFLRPDSFIVGDSLTYADVILAGHFSVLKGVDPEALKNYPEIEKYIEKVYSQPRLAKYLASRPASAF